MKTSLVIIGLITMSLVLSGCETVDYYELRQVPTSTPIYEKQNKPVKETYYVTEKQPYETTDMVTETVTIDPLISGDNLVLALTRLAGGSREEGERVQTALDIGFSELNEQKLGRNISLIPRVRLLLKLTEEELQGQGPAVIKVLTEEFGVNILCTGTILDSGQGGYKRLLVQILNLRTDEFLSERFSGDSWESVGYQIASAFFGTRTETKAVPRIVVKYRDTSVAKTRMVDNWENVLVGEKKGYQTKEVYLGKKNVFGIAPLLTDAVVATLMGFVGSELVGYDATKTERNLAGIGIGLSSAAIFNVVANYFITPRTVVR